MKTLVRGTTVVLSYLLISMHSVFAQHPDRQDIQRAQVRSYDGVSIPAAWRKPDGEDEVQDVLAVYSEHADMPHGFYWGNSEHPPRQFFEALQVTTEFVEGQISEKNSAESFTTEDYYRVDKIDVHAHIRTEDPGFVELAKRDRFRLVNIATQSAGPEEMRLRYFAGYAQLKAHPDRVIFVSSFPMTGWNDPDWQEKTIRHLDETFAKGAVAVKVWKNIGMEFRDKDGKFVMIDDPKLDPIFAHLAKKGVRVIGHLGEPRECWLPIERMVMHRGYYASHPKYHMYLHPEMPSYEDQIAARDRMLEKHPDLRFLGAHLGSLEWSVDHLAAFLDRFPKVIVETAARVRDLQYQSSLDRKKVRDFLIKYQDRVAYGTDFGVRATDTPDQAIENARRRWLANWNYSTLR